MASYTEEIVATIALSNILTCEVPPSATMTPRTFGMYVRPNATGACTVEMLSGILTVGNTVEERLTSVAVYPTEIIVCVCVCFFLTSHIAYIGASTSGA